MSERLRNAVRNEEVPPYLEAKIRANVRAAQSSTGRTMWARPWAMAATAAAVCIVGVVIYGVGYLRFTAESEEAYTAKLTMQVGTLMRVGLGDHIYCSLFRKYPKDAPRLEELKEELGAEYEGLLPIVRSQVAGNFRLMMAHECRYRDRDFVHLTLQRESRLVSLVITRKGAGESFQTEQLVASLTQAGIPIYQSEVKQFQLAAFESRDRLVYVISDLPKQQNMQMMAALAPQVQAYLKTIEL